MNLNIFQAKKALLGLVYMIPLSRDEMRGGIILMHCNMSRLVIQQKITIFLGVDCTILGNQKTLKTATVILFTYMISFSQHFGFFTGGVNFR